MSEPSTAGKPSRVFVSVGSNVLPEVHVPRAVARLADLATLVGVSPFYLTAAIGPDGAASGEADFWNGVVALHTSEDPVALHTQTLRELEEAAGRTRPAPPYDPRTLDLDVIWADHAVSHDPRLELPDPHILTRPFLARGLLDLDPSLCWPATGARLADLVPQAAHVGRVVWQP